MKYEVEQKYPVDSIQPIQQQLEQLGAQPGEPIVQVDSYFNHPARDFAATDEALRIRRVGEQNCVTYKGPKVDSTTKTRHEIELPIAAGDAGAAEFAQLLTVLGFTPVAEVRKTRTPLQVEWQGKTVEVALDQVDSLGQFVELELVATEGQLDNARDTINALATHLGLTNSERRGYLDLLLRE